MALATRANDASYASIPWLYATVFQQCAKLDYRLLCIFPLLAGILPDDYVIDGMIGLPLLILGAYGEQRKIFNEDARLRLLDIKMPKIAKFVTRIYGIWYCTREARRTSIRHAYIAGICFPNSKHYQRRRHRFIIVLPYDANISLFYWRCVPPFMHHRHVTSIIFGAYYLVSCIIWCRWNRIHIMRCKELQVLARRISYEFNVKCAGFRARFEI